MGARASTVHINHNRYDSATGQMIGAVKKVAGQVKQQTGLGVIDGMVRRPIIQPTQNPIVQKNPVKTAGATAATQTREHFEKSARDLHAKTQRSYALMRRAVTKPATVFKPTAAPSAKTSISPTLKPKVLDNRRAARAETITKHAKVRRFSLSSAASKQTVEPAAKIGPKSSYVRPKAMPKAAAASASQPMPSMVASASHQQLERMLDFALTRADSHKQTLKKQNATRNLWQRLKHLPKWMQFGLIIVVLTAAISAAWYKVPFLSYKVASVRAHLSVSVPVAPMGYKITGATSYQAGTVTTQFKSTTGDQSFVLTQQSDGQDSSALKSSIAPNDQATQTTQTPSGSSIIQTPSKAACVSGGVASMVSSLTPLPPQATEVLAQNC